MLPNYPQMRLLLFFVLATLFACTVKEAQVSPPTADSPPNILLFIADDWSYPHAGVYGDRTVKTPNFDALAAGGMLFTNAYCASPSCSPSRASMLTGRYPHQNGVAGNLWSEFPAGLIVYPEVLQEAGYLVGHDQKGWAPGDYQAQGREHNPAGKRYQNIGALLDQKKTEQPFCFWFGSSDPHRVYTRNLGAWMGMKPDSVDVPPFLPDVPCVRNDIMDYYAEVERFDRHIGQVIDLLRARGELDNTLIIVTSDNGMPFPRAKATVYDAGTRMPFVAHWPARIPAGTRHEGMVNLASLAPTFLEAAGQVVPAEMTLPSLLPYLENEKEEGAKEVIIERERHAQVRADSGSYAVRAFRTKDFLYVRNFYPERWPAGDPEAVLSVGAFGDVDNSISKMLILREPQAARFQLAFGKRPAEELYHVHTDPHQLNNLAKDPAWETKRAELQARMEARLRETNDLRMDNPRTNFWDKARYTPTYKKHDFDLEAYLAGYEYAHPKGPTSFEYLKCLE